ncbi:ankyrin repeat protein [Trichoderma guizhouense]|uniref:Ankyrin repeat protein n=1 Tax=Trichoderma guizhouense TaxID=1491466 RepID=A0A1T3CI84_9HYPO|nr:ankyrin repeat protein [Trichoderma guizhouense]
MTETNVETPLVAQPQHQIFLSPLDAAWDPSLPTDDIDEYCWTPLQLAARSGELQIVQEILASNPSAVNDPPSGYYGQTALQAACMQGHEETVRSLLDAGADVHFCGGNNFQRTGLQIACGQGNENVVRMLLAAGSEINMSPATNHGIRVLTQTHQTAQSAPKTFAVARYNGRTALQAASERGHLSIVKLLLELGAAVNAPPSPIAGRTALQAACSGGFVAVVQLLLENGAQVNAPSARYKGITALQGACLQGSTEIVDLLLKSGADVQASGGGYDGDGTALHAAAEKGYIEIVKKLVDIGADVNSSYNRRGQTPIQGAMAGGHEEVVEYLRDKGAVGRTGGGIFIFNHSAGQ